MITKGDNCDALVGFIVNNYYGYYHIKWILNRIHTKLTFLFTLCGLFAQPATV